MSEQAIVERIISDAKTEAEGIIADAQRKAEETVTQANIKAERNLKGTEAEIKERVNGIFEVKAAAARLDCAKIMLGEKRAVIDEIYSRALSKLVGLGKADALSLAEKLLSSYAEEGDEIVFAENYKYAKDVSALPVVKTKKLKVSKASAEIDGGFILLGKSSDKDISFGSLLKADREEHQAKIAADLFTVK